MKKIKLYGIPNCDTVKKAKKYLDNNGVDYEFINFKKEAPTKALVKRWTQDLGELPVNKRGTTFRKIKEEFEGATQAGQINVLVENSSAIKRPILEKADKVLAIGFKEADWSDIKL